MNRNTIFKIVAVMMLTAFLFIAAGCANTGEKNVAQKQAEEKALGRTPYEMKNDVEFNNYNRRQVLADDPTVILWCTSAFPVPSSPLFTVPIVGKLTSGGKRPYPTQITRTYDGDQYFPEIPGPDSMYGSSGEYRYGFTPAGVYADFYGISTFCTTEPMIWQRESTKIVMQSDPTLLDAQNKAREALKNGDSTGAEKILEEAVKKAQGGK